MSDEFDPLKLFKSFFQKKELPPPRHSPAVTKFLEWMDKLDHNDRIKRVVALGQESLSEDEAISKHAQLMIGELEKGSFYERQLALMSASATNPARIMRFNKDSSARLRRLAAGLCVTTCAEEDVHAILSSRKGKEQRNILKRLNRARRTDVVDSFLRGLAEKGSDELRQLLFYGSSTLVEELLPDLAEQLDRDDLARFSYRHPDLCLDYLEKCLPNIQREDPAFLQLLFGSFRWLSEFRPDKTLRLFEKLLKFYPASRLPYKELLHLRPSKTVEVLSAQPEYGNAEFNCIIRRLPDGMILDAVATNYYSTTILQNFRKLQPDLRQKIYEKCGEVWRNADGAIPANVLEQLPKETRLAEAKKSLSLANLSAKLVERLYYARLLEWDDVLKETKDSLNNPEPESRCLGFFNLIAALKFNRSRLPEILELLHKRKNEADPVRLQFFSAMSTLPPSMFAGEQLEMLELVFYDALRAQDLSNSSLYYVGRLLARLAPFHLDWVLAQQARILRDRGPYAVTSSPFRMLDDEVRKAATAWKSVIEYWESKERESEICQLAAWFDKRLEHFEPLVDALCRLAKHAKSTYTSEQALRILAEHVPKTFRALVPELLQLDHSWSLNRTITRYLGHKRQCMLTPYLGQTAFSGRFSTGKTRVVPDFNSGFHKWTETQVRIYKKELNSLAEHATSNHSDRIFAISRLGLLPEPDAAVLDRIAALDNKDEAIRDSAIRVLAHLDDGSGLTILLSMLNDDRARLAIYALRKAVLNMDPDKALEMLKAVPRTKVTVFKEVIRLAGDTRSEEAFQWLRELESGDLHRDARVALLRALWNFPEQEQTWEILRRTMAGGDHVFTELAIRFPTNSLSKAARKNLLLLYNDALQSGDTRTRIKTLMQVSSGTILDPELILSDVLKERLGSEAEDESSAAAWLVSGLYAGRGLKKLDTFLKAVINKPRNLRVFIQQMQRRCSFQKPIYADDIRSLCAFLSNHPETTEYKISLAGSTLPMSEFFSILKSTDSEAKLHFGVMQTACNVLSQSSRINTEELEDIETKLSKEKSDNLRRLGLAALCGLGQNAGGWTPERLRRLQTYRADSALVVSSAALFTLPSAELLSETIA